jgi:hypothetical protein
MKNKKTRDSNPPAHENDLDPFDFLDDDGGDFISDQDVMDVLGAYDWSTYVVKEGDKIGLKTKEGEIILPPQIDDIRQLMEKEPQKGDLVVAQVKGKWGIIAADGKGTWIIEPGYDKIGYPNNLTYVQKDGKYGVLDLSKREFLIPLACDKIWDDMGFMFTNGIGYYEKGGKIGVIDESGRFTDAVFEDVDGEPEGLVKVKYNGKWGFVREDNGFTEMEAEGFYWYSLE